MKLRVDMSLFNPIRNDIHRIGSFLGSLDKALYVQPLPVISGGTVGQHVRHVLEFYSCILLDSKDDLICYDGRKRDLKIENDNTFALHVSEQLMLALQTIMIDKKVCVRVNYDDANQHDVYLKSTLFRELAYALDHSIHHQAIVKIGLSGMPGLSDKINELGVAPSTLRYRKNGK